MKGLLIKDVRLMMNQKQFFGVVLLIMIIFLGMNYNTSFVVSYITVVFSIIVITTISYDEYDNGMSYLFTLPVSRKGYVREKYVFGIVSTVLSFLAVSALAFAVNAIRQIEFDVEEWLFTGVAILLVITIILAVNIPLQLRFEADKSRVALLGTVAVGFGIAYAIVKICLLMGIDVAEAIARIAEVNMKGCIAGACVFWAVGMLLSYLVAIRVMEKKEF